MYRWLKHKLRKFRSKRAKNIASEILWGQVFDFAIRDSEWFTSTRLNPGRWALGFPALYILFRTLDEVRPRNIIEFGLGESTRMTSQYLSHFPGVELTVIEQSKEWKDIWCRNYPEMKENIKVAALTVSYGRKQIRQKCRFEGLTSVIKGKKYDLVIIDGPWGAIRDSRCEILDIVEAGLLADDFVIIFDDTEREGERDTLKKLRKLLKAKDIHHCTGKYCGQKGTTIVCSEKYGFLKSL